MRSKLFILFALVVVLAISLFSTTLCFAEETTEETEVVENTDPIFYETAKEKATEVVEELNLREYLIKYFDENMVEMIISIVITVIAVLIITGYIVYLCVKLHSSIKKYGVESEATKAIANTLKKQLEEAKNAVEDFKNMANTVKENEDAIKAQYDKILKVLEIGFTNDISLVQRGIADNIKETINGEEVNDA